jgi:hypothetical protein
VRDRLALSLVNRVWWATSRDAASLPSTLDFASGMARGNCVWACMPVVFVKLTYLTRIEDLMDMPKERVHELLGTTSEVNYCSFAAVMGNLELLQWLRGHGYAWDHEVCSSAANGGQLEILKWARVNQCPWTEQTLFDARCTLRMVTPAGNYALNEVLEWCIANGCPGGEQFAKKKPSDE